MAPQRTTNKADQQKQKLPSSTPTVQPQETSHPLLELQQNFGNQAVLHLMRSGAIQARLAINQPGDIYEQEAERVVGAIATSTPSAFGNHHSADHNVKNNKLLHRATTQGPAMGTESVSDNFLQHQGPGQPLDTATRTTLESNLGVDLSSVRVHDDNAAHEAASSINARAFTHGNDIWLGQGESQNNISIMAHEATHVVQQAGSMNQTVQRAQVKTGGGSGLPVALPDTGTVEEGQKKITIPMINLPAFKISRHKDKYSSELTMPNEERDTDQLKKWKSDVKADVDSKMDTKLKDAEYVKSPTSGRKIYFLKSTSEAADFYIFGTPQAIKDEVQIPYWDPLGRERLMAVDHRLEVQLGGKDEAENMELLDASANSSSGSAIRSEIESRVTKAVVPYITGPKKIAGWNKAPSLKELLKEGWKITFKNAKIGLQVSGEPMLYWKREDIKSGKHLDKLHVMKAAEIEQAGLRGSPTELVIFTAKRGGTPRRIPLPQGASNIQHVSIKNFYPGFNLTEILYDTNAQEDEKVGLITGDIFKNNTQVEGQHVTWELRKAPGTGYGGYINDLGILAEIKNKLKLIVMSPIELLEARLDDKKGLYAVGRVMPTVPLFRDIGLDLVLEGEDIRVRKLFAADEFSFPGPILVTSSSLEIFVGTESGLGIHGEVNFEIERVGHGRMGAAASTGKGFAVEGEFNFDTKLFDPAQIKAWYRNDKFGAEGEIGIKENKVRGIKTASIKASYKEGRLEASGNAQLSIPGVKEGSLMLSYSEAEGFAIGGSFQLADNIPGIKGGSVEAQVKKKPGEDRYIVSATGKAEPKIPGVKAALAVTYDDGTFDISGSAAYDKGMVKGSIMVGATNRPVDDQGRPAGEPGKRLIAYGGGAATIQIAPWLQGTIGVKLLPNGEIEVSGSIGLPSSLDIFPEKKLDKNIFTIGIDIPIVGVAVAGQRIGIFANISGGLDLSAGIGPGQLQELGLSVTYNPTHEEQTHVKGGAKLHIPAHAGLRLFVRGGIGAGIPVVSAQAGLEIGGGLGLEGAVDAGVQIDWTPVKGLVLDAAGEIYVEPKLKFDITGFVLVEADLLLTTIELYNKRWKLAGFEYGSGLRFGLKFPIHYEENKPFNISLNDVQFQVPEIKPKELLTDLIKKVV